MNYYTVKELSDRLGIENIYEARQENKNVSIQLKGGLISRKCDYCKKGEHTGASVRPRIKIKGF